MPTEYTCRNAILQSIYWLIQPLGPVKYAYCATQTIAYSIAAFFDLEWVVTMLVCLMWLWCLVMYWWRSWFETMTESLRFARRAAALQVAAQFKRAGQKYHCSQKGLPASSSY